MMIILSVFFIIRVFTICKMYKTISKLYDKDYLSLLLERTMGPVTKLQRDKLN